MANNYHSSDINKTDRLPVKPVYVIGSVTVAVLDKSIVKKLGVNEDTFFEQEMSNDGIILHLIRNVSL